MGCYVILGEPLGTGAYGTVWKAVDAMTGNVFAIKRLKKKFCSYEECLNLVEVRCMRELVHPNIVRLHDVIMESNTLYLVLEWMDCDLYELIKARGHPFSEEEVSNLSFQLFKGLAYMHKQGYCHRDLKPENLLVSQDTIKIADFGLAKNMLHELGKPLQSYVWTSPYRAPELLLGSTHYDFAIDIWAMGVIMAELLAGHHLFATSMDVNQIYKICSVIGCPDSHTWLEGLPFAASLDYNFPEEFRFVDSTESLCSLIPGASTEAIDLIKSLLSWDPKSRPTAIKALQHPFFIPCENTNTLIPSSYLQPRYQTPITYHSETQEQKHPYNDNAGLVFLNNSYSLGQQIVNSMPQFHPPYTVTEPIVKTFPERNTLQINPVADPVGSFQQQLSFNYDDLNSRAISREARELSFPVVNSYTNSLMRVTTQIPESDPSSFSPAYSIWRQVSYKGP